MPPLALAVLADQPPSFVALISDEKVIQLRAWEPIAAGRTLVFVYDGGLVGTQKIKGCCLFEFGNRFSVAHFESLAMRSSPATKMPNVAPIVSPR